MKKTTILHTMPAQQLMRQSKHKLLFGKLKRFLGVSQKQVQPLDPREPLLWTMIRNAPSHAVHNVVQHIALLQQLGCSTTVKLILSQTPNVIGYWHRCFHEEKLIFQAMMMLQVTDDEAALFSVFGYED